MNIYQSFNRVIGQTYPGVKLYAGRDYQYLIYNCDGVYRSRSVYVYKLEPADLELIMDEAALLMIQVEAQS